MSTSQKGVVFLDSSIIIRYFIGDNSAKEVLEGHSKFAINSIVYSEVAFNLLKLLYVDKYGKYRFYGMKSALSGRDSYLLKRIQNTLLVHRRASKRGEASIPPNNIGRNRKGN